MFGMLEKVRSLSGSAKAFGASLLAGGMAVFSFVMFGSRALSILLTGMIVVALVLVAYVVVRRVLAARKAARFGLELSEEVARAPGGLTGEQQAAHAMMAERFREGIQVFGRAGKDLYSLPWYVIIGEPGSGKTEAIRHSHLGFPPDLHDELQGTGGTINMNWWFTNHAVILDTAGGLLFDEVRSDSEWKSFLDLLNEHRPHCPINGVFLVIPADRLLEDREDEASHKAGVLARQLMVIQQRLDLRFPVYVLVTKCDLILGFREFFEGVQGQDSQQQMVGWSNPDPIDDTFRPERLESHLQRLIDRLFRERLELLRDPAQVKPMCQSRTDEVDALFDFPHSFRRILPPLREYLQRLFISGEWTTKPLFLRGIYFTSSMREGAALDNELAELLGVPASSLPDDRAWARESSYFLRDVFLHKAFVESGLVTRATNVRKQVQRRRLMLMGAGAASVILLLFLTWGGAFLLRNRIGDETVLWNLAAREAKAAASARNRAADRQEPYIVRPPWLSILDHRGRGSFVIQDSKLHPEGAITLKDLHARLFAESRKDIQVPMIFRAFRPFDNRLNEGRRLAYRALYEQSVFDPLVEATRYRMQADVDSPWTAEATDALNGLIRVEAVAADKDYENLVAVDRGIPMNEFFGFAVDAAHPATIMQQSRLWLEIYQTLYTGETHRGRRRDVMGRLAIGSGRRENPPIHSGVRRFTEQCLQSGAWAELERRIARIEADLATQLSDYATIQREFDAQDQSYRSKRNRTVSELLDATTTWGLFPEWNRRAKEWDASYDAWKNEWEMLDARMTELKQSVEGIDWFQAEDISGPFSNSVVEATHAAHACFRELALPVSSIAQSTNAAAEAQDLFDDLWLYPGQQLDWRIRAMEQRDVRGQVRHTAGEFRGYQDHYERILNEQAAYPSIPLADTLRIKEDWNVFGQQLDQLLLEGELEYRREDLHDAAVDMQRRIAAYQKVPGLSEWPELAQWYDGTEAAVQSVNESRQGRLFNRRLRQVLKRWNVLTDLEPLAARNRILDQTPETFLDQYLVPVEDPWNITAQYWVSFVEAGINDLADRSESDLTTLSRDLHDRSGFPLNVESGGKTLAAADVRYFRNMLFALRQPAGGETLRDGVPTEVPGIDGSLALLRAEGVGPPLSWVTAASAMCDALPTEGFYQCKVYLLSLQAHSDALIQESRGVDAKELFAGHVWRGMEFQVENQRAIRVKTEQASTIQLGVVAYPGGRFKLDLFPLPSATTPSATFTSPDGPWSLLELVYRYGKPRPDQLTTWVVSVPFVDAARSGHKRYLLLWLEFERPLPVRSSWPRWTRPPSGGPWSNPSGPSF